MRKEYWIAITAAALLLAGCSQETKEHAKATAQSAAKDTAAVAQKAQTEASQAMQKAKAAASEALEKAKEAAAKAKEQAAAVANEAMKKAQESAAQAETVVKAKATEAAAVVQKKAAEVQKSLSGGDAAKGAALFAKCAGCHGAKGQMKALGKSPVIAGEPAASIVEKLKAYKAGTRNAYGMGGVMQGQVAGLSDADIQALAAYISTLK